MRALRLLAPVLSGLLLLLTYFLVQGATPDAALHERTLDALQQLILNDAALQRDVLRGRTGMLRNYDPLVRSVENMRAAAARLQTADHVASGPMRQEIQRRIEAAGAAVRDQESLVDAFKSGNALLQNSLNYLGHVLARTGSADGIARDPAAAEIGTVATAVLGFLQDPRGDSATGLTAALDRLERSQANADPQSAAHALLAHGRLILATLPQMDDLVARLQAAPIRERALDLQDMYLDFYGRADARAGVFRILLYAASVALAGYVGYLFLRLRANARSLQNRLNLEQMIVEISAQFIGLSRARINDEIRDGLARVAQHAGVDRAHILVHGADMPGADRSGADTSGIESSYLWLHPRLVMPPGRPEDILPVAAHWSRPGYERQGCIHVPDVQSLPASAEKSHLQKRGIRSWLCIPLGLPGKRIGFLTLDTVAAEKRWLDDDIALLRTAGEIFASAIERERSEAEREALEARMHQAERLKAIGTLAGGIAHEFNNILGAILGYCEMGLEALQKPGAPRRRHLQQIMKAGRRAQGIVDQILAFSRRSDQQYRPIAAKPVVAETLDLLRASLPATLAIRPQLGRDDAKLLGNATQLQQVVMNLCTNAAQAIEGHGAIDIGLDTVDVVAERSLSHGTLPAGRYVRLAVTDTGPGMDATVKQRIFEPFFTTKRPGRGSGLGLATVHGIVTQHGGAVNVRSRPGEGSTFETYFPQTDETPCDDKPAEVAAPLGHGETVLLVDDETPLVALGEEMLAVLGYEPVGFRNSTAALAAFHADPQRFDLVLTDEVMPEMTGTELATALHQIRPDLPIVLMTGYVGPVQSRALATAGIREVLKKPLLSRTLANCLARYLPMERSPRHPAP
jgi:signal transduction histidine kinase/ActR/RegA family two-component response regulator